MWRGATLPSALYPLDHHRYPSGIPHPPLRYPSSSPPVFLFRSRRRCTPWATVKSFSPSPPVSSAPRPPPASFSYTDCRRCEFTVGSYVQLPPSTSLTPSGILFRLRCARWALWIHSPRNFRRATSSSGDSSCATRRRASRCKPNRTHIYRRCIYITSTRAHA